MTEPVADRLDQRDHLVADEQPSVPGVVQADDGQLADAHRVEG
ncbi:hypothetical protein [Actinomadura fibrosa]|uniref:Uncharacterized protein n=1 Tax=Actinomadura fibrosa TaxID=111802 RepID=A0ABW2XSZ8_9ACTN|nr:hypothetical protein [Actinomadura fibrosa]